MCRWARPGAREESDQLTLVQLVGGDSVGFGHWGIEPTWDRAPANEADERGASVAESHGDTHDYNEREVERVGLKVEVEVRRTISKLCENERAR